MSLLLRCLQASKEYLMNAVSVRQVPGTKYTTATEIFAVMKRQLPFNPE